jgi:hypothetical protein
VTWAVGNVRFVGTGIGDKNFIAVSYRSGSDTGLALYRADGGTRRDYGDRLRDYGDSAFNCTFVKSRG